MLRDNHPWWRQAMSERGELPAQQPSRIRLRHKLQWVLIGVAAMVVGAIALF